MCLCFVYDHQISQQMSREARMKKKKNEEALIHAWTMKDKSCTTSRSQNQIYPCVSQNESVKSVRFETVLILFIYFLKFPCSAWISIHTGTWKWQPLLRDGSLAVVMVPALNSHPEMPNCHIARSTHVDQNTLHLVLTMCQMLWPEGQIFNGLLIIEILGSLLCW